MLPGPLLNLFCFVLGLLASTWAIFVWDSLSSVPVLA